jgi:hypothetical protein
MARPNGPANVQMANGLRIVIALEFRPRGAEMIPSAQVGASHGGSGGNRADQYEEKPPSSANGVP